MRPVLFCYFVVKVLVMMSGSFSFLPWGSFSVFRRCSCPLTWIPSVFHMFLCP